MSIHGHLPPQARKELKGVGWTKGLELAKWREGMGRSSIVQPGCTSRSLPKDQFTREVEKELTGRESEPCEIIYFKLYKTRFPLSNRQLRPRP
jgi:hypothetical protein